MSALVMVKTSLGRCAHWKAEGHRTALCGGPGPFVAGGEGLPMCLCCQRREAKVRAGVSDRGCQIGGARPSERWPLSPRFVGGPSEGTTSPTSGGK